MTTWRKAGMQQMLDSIVAEVAHTRDLTGVGTLDDRVLEAIAQVPRDEFVPADMKSWAFENRPLPIGLGQTISQPYIVALMTQLLALAPDDIVLEVGTGSGYQTAILSCLCRMVYSMDLFPALADAARARLTRLGFGNIDIRSGNGHEGWAEFAPYDGIIVTAAARDVPDPLLEQLKPGGNLVVPVGAPGKAQSLKWVHKNQRGAVRVRDVIGVVFVPLIASQDGTEQ